LTGAVIGLSVGNPVLALAVAFVSHFVCDLIPHHDDPSIPLGSKEESTILLVDCLGAVGVATFLFVLRPEAWFLACWCAFLATSPDLMWVPRFLCRVRTHKDKLPNNPVTRFHAWVQPFARPWGVVIEFIWATGMITLLANLVVI
jgi:hypothetical protein